VRDRAQERELARIERKGLDPYLWASGGELVHQDSSGKLWEFRIERGETIALVEVRDATPHADGRRQLYLLRVPPHMRTARRAVAWTFGKTSYDYRPIREA
jgi:hypothetical protein